MVDPTGRDHDARGRLIGSAPPAACPASRLRPSKDFMATPDQPVDRLVAALRTAARDLAAKRSIRDLHLTLERIVLAAVDTVPHVDSGGVSITEDGQITSRSPSDDVVMTLDALQSRLGEGPCITAIREPRDDGMVLADDLAGDDGLRWPRFAPQAVDAGYRSILSIQLTTDGGMRAALNLYSGGASVFDLEARQIAGLFGVQAAMLLYGSEQAMHLQRAIDNRDSIGQAKGILMERFTVDEEEAFQMLVRSSQDTNMKLVDVSQWLRSEAAERRAQRDPGPIDERAADRS